MKRAWQILEAFFALGSEANYPASPGGQTIVLGSDGVARWSDTTAGGGELLVEDGAYELLFDDETGDVLYEG